MQERFSICKETDSLTTKSCAMSHILKFICASILLTTTLVASAQKDDEETERKLFRKENLFTGGSVNVSFFNGATILGANPVFGYSINRFVDAGIALNFTYIGNTEFTGDRVRQTVWGPGVFARLYPVNFLFVQGQFERNFIKLKFLPSDGSASQRFDLSANSLLLGGGYCSGRQGVGDLFYYFSVMVDVTRDQNSPYIELLQNGSLRAIPVIRAGLNIPLFRNRNRRDF
jgi:hypothetical protein